MRTSWLVCCVLLVCWLTLTGCGRPPTTTLPAGPTYSADVAPIFNDKCVKCHQASGIAPFRLDTYESAKANAAPIAAAVEGDLMPPFYIAHDGTCGEFADVEALTASEKATVLAWATGEAAEGMSPPLTAAPLPHLNATTELKTPTFAPVPQGGALAEFDEYRCFILPRTADHDTFITGYEVDPGTPQIIHHVLGFLVDPTKLSSDGTNTNGQVMQQLDAQSPDRDGWPCFGGVDDQGLVNVDALPIAWAPGQGIVEYPAQMGVPLPERDVVVVQVHYNLADPSSQGLTDSTTLRLRTADSVQRKLAVITADGFLQTLFSQSPAQLPPGAASAPYTWKATTSELGLGSVPYVDVMAVLPHMHQRGRTFELRYQDGTGADACGARIDRWDFHWQRMYFYRDGSIPRLTPQSAIQVTCDYDTSTDTQPVTPGWGTRNEMCMAVMMVALPEGI
jgi:hypothetical protein